MAGFLLSRMGVDVLVLEKHADFLRDFRGDTIHPSTLELMYELGLLDEFLKRPHQEIREITAQVGNGTATLGEFTHLPTHCRFLAQMPQWDFLNFLCEQAVRYPDFHFRNRTEVTDLIQEQGKITGLRAKTPDSEIEVLADLIIAADGRHSIVRKQAQLKAINLGAPMDVLWMRLSRRPGDPGQTFGRADSGRLLVLIQRNDYWQCAYVIAKGTIGELRQRGLTAFREEIARLSPFLHDRVQELKDWKQVSLLTVVVDRLETWSRPGLLCIGDAAHAMSPIGGVGINLAIQDAVATANILGPALLRGVPTRDELQKVQERREFPTRAIQRMQIMVQNRVIKRVLSSTRPLSLPWPLRLLNSWPFLRRFPARFIGMGPRPEHVKTPDVHAYRESLAA